MGPAAEAALVAEAMANGDKTHWRSGRPIVPPMPATPTMIAERTGLPHYRVEAAMRRIKRDLGRQAR